jgi:amino acid permease
MQNSKLSATIALLMILNGLFYASNIYVLGNHEAAIAMHDDLSPDAGPIITMAKVLVCFVVGICYLVAGLGIFSSKKDLVQLGVWGCLLFLALYIIELILWGTTHTRVWRDFAIFGGVSIVFGLFSYRYWKNAKEKGLNEKSTTQGIAGI